MWDLSSIRCLLEHLTDREFKSKIVWKLMLLYPQAKAARKGGWETRQSNWGHFKEAGRAAGADGSDEHIIGITKLSSPENWNCVHSMQLLFLILYLLHLCEKEHVVFKLSAILIHLLFNIRQPVVCLYSRPPLDKEVLKVNYLTQSLGMSHLWLEPPYRSKTPCQAKGVRSLSCTAVVAPHLSVVARYFGTKTGVFILISCHGGQLLSVPPSINCQCARARITH